MSTIYSKSSLGLFDLEPFSMGFKYNSVYSYNNCFCHFWDSFHRKIRSYPFHSKPFRVLKSFSCPFRLYFVLSMHMRPYIANWITAATFGTCNQQWKSFLRQLPSPRQQQQRIFFDISLARFGSDCALDLENRKSDEVTTCRPNSDSRNHLGRCQHTTPLRWTSFQIWRLALLTRPLPGILQEIRLRSASTSDRTT